MAKHVLAIDQGTTSSRAIVFNADQKIVSVAQQEFPQHFPQSGWVEHDAEDIWQSVLKVLREAIAKADIEATDIVSIGITNQRETTVLWDRETGKPVSNAIVWQDRRTADFCSKLKDQGHEPEVTEKTGLLLDPYFSGTKVRWILDNVSGVREAAIAGKLAFGTIDSFLLWRLTGGKVHATDATNASRTMLYNINKGGWDVDLLKMLDIPIRLLPEVHDSNAEFGLADPSLLGTSIPIRGVAGDQQAATLGQACFSSGMMKSTYGTGCFALLNTGAERVHSKNRLLSTIAYQLNGEVTYALEGSIFVAGAAVQWLRDELGTLEEASQAGKMAAKADPAQDVYLVPAFTGLGAPYWDANARGAMFGLTRNSGPNEFARAALESVCYQTRDLLDAMRKDQTSAKNETTLRVDGGMVASDWTMQYLADILNAPVDRPVILETTAMGAAWLAASASDFWPGQDEFAANWKAEKRFEPAMKDELREQRYSGWLDCVGRTRT